MPRLLIADDHPIVLEGLAALFGAAEFEVAARCRSGDEVATALAAEHFDILLLDITMPPHGGLAILRTLRERGTPHKVVLLSSSIAQHEVVEALELGVDGIVLKEAAPRQLLSCLTAVEAGERWFDPAVTHLAFARSAPPRPTDTPGISLTPRERDIVQFVARGLRNKEIARELGITEGTVKAYLHAIYEKLDVTSRVELLNHARRVGLIGPW